MYNARAMRCVILGVVVLALAVPLPAAANHIPVETLLQRMFTDPAPTPYDATADFDGDVVITWRAGRITARAAGSYREWRLTFGAPRRRQVTITRLDLPFVLRPFEGNLKSLIEQRIEREEGALSLLDDYDVFIAEELPNGRYVLGAVRKDIVTDVMQRYGRASDLKDVNVRRAIAKWLYLPRQRELVTRPGGPYIVTAVVDEQGTYYGLQLIYDWGPVGTELDWANVGGRLIWREVKMDAAMDVRGIGRVEGKMSLRFSNHCFNGSCRR